MSSVVYDDVAPAPGGALIGLIPATAGAAVLYALKRMEAEEFAQVASAAVTILVGAPLARRTIRRDEERSARSIASSAEAADDGTSSTKRSHVQAGSKLIVNPSAAAVGLVMVLGAATFWLLDVLTSMAGWGSLGFFGEAIPGDDSSQFWTASLRALPLLFLGGLILAVWVAHRLRHRAAGALYTATVFYVMAVIATNMLFANIAERSLTSDDVIIPMVGGAIVFAACFLGDKLGRQTQERFDVMHSAAVQLRTQRSAGRATESSNEASTQRR